MLLISQGFMMKTTIVSFCMILNIVAYGMARKFYDTVTRRMATRIGTMDITYHMLAYDKFKLDYVIEYDDGAFLRRSIEWGDCFEKKTHSDVLRRKLRKSTREDDKEAIEFMLDWKRVLGEESDLIQLD